MPLLTTISLIVFIAVIITNIWLSIFVYKNNPNSATNVLFAFLGFAVSAWNAVHYISYFPPFSLFLVRFSLALAIFMAMAFILLASTLPHAKFQLSKKWTIFVVLLGIAVMAITLSPYTFTKLAFDLDSPNPVPGPGLPIFGLTVIGMNIAAVTMFFVKMRRATGLEREQLRLVMIGISIMFGLIISTILFPVLFFSNDSAAPFASLYTSVFLALTAYAIVKHRFLETRIIAIRATSYTLFLVFCATLYALIVFVLFKKILKISIDTTVAIGVLFFSVGISLTFQIILNAIRHFTKRVFFKEEYDSDRLLTDLTHIMAQTIDLESMATSIVKLLTEEMRLSKAALLVVDRHKITDIFGIGYKIKSFEASNLEQLFHKARTKNEFITSEIEKGEMKKLLRRLDVEVAFPIKMGNVEVAILVFGPKLSGEIYGVQDINFLNILAPEAGIAIQNAKSYQEIKKFSQVLEKRVEERTRELKDVHKRELAKAQEIAKLKDEFVFIAAHELRTPVTAIRGFIDLISSELQQTPEDVRKNLKYIGAASEQLGQLVNELLEISRSESGTMKIAVKSEDISALVREITSELKPLADKENIVMKLTIDPNVTPALVDIKKMHEIAMNLISNAIKYNRPGGEIDIHIFPAENAIILEVHDTGYGIPAHDQPKIFQKFFRASAPETQEILGTGLGLFITRMLVEKMNGKIMFSSKEGEGSTFAVSLPKA